MHSNNHLDIRWMNGVLGMLPICRIYSMDWASLMKILVSGIRGGWLLWRRWVFFVYELAIICIIFATLVKSEDILCYVLYDMCSFSFGAYVYFRYAYYISFLFFVCICEPFNICISQNSRVDTCSILYFDIIALFVLVRWLIRIVRKELVWCVYFRVLYLFQWSDTIWGRGDNTSWEDIDMHCCFNSHTHRLYQETPSHKECTFYISFFFYF